MAKKSRKPDKYKMIRALTIEQIMKALDYIDGDGHTVFKYSALIECGWPEETALAVCTEQTSDGSWKGSIWGKDGKMIKECFGWYSLDLLYAIARSFDVKFGSCMGRGFQAREIDRALRAHFKGEPANATV
jgi:hypothetical protein